LRKRPLPDALKPITGPVKGEASSEQVGDRPGGPLGGEKVKSQKNRIRVSEGENGPAEEGKSRKKGLSEGKTSSELGRNGGKIENFFTEMEFVKE